MSCLSQVSEGYYTIGAISKLSTTIAASDSGAVEHVRHDKISATSPAIRIAEAICEPGYWCEEGIRYPCEAGTFGDEFGMVRGNCSGLCNPGFLCGNRSATPKERPCGVRDRNE